MKAPKRILLLFCVLAGFSASGNICAQWKEIAPFQVANYFPNFLQNAKHGAIHFSNGVLWAGWRDLWSSSDTGKTWQKNTIGLPNGYIVTDINFFDKFNGLVASVFMDNAPSFDGILFLTNDGGLNWKRILSVPSELPNATFNGSASIIHTFTGDGNFYTSLDGGLTWKNSRPGVDFGSCFTIAKDKTIYALTSFLDQNNLDAGLIGNISASTDLGASWTNLNAPSDGDSHTMCADSCDANRIYLVNENYESTDLLNLSQLYTSRDAAKTWASSLAFSRDYFSGSMTCTANVIFASTITNLIYRSTDQGISWKGYPGPKSAFDSRNIACVNDNTVFALSDDGSIWETINSGGDSISGIGVNDLILSQNSLFSNDSIIVCDTSIWQSITLQPKGCTPPGLVNVQVIGSDSLSYTATKVTSDSIALNFLPAFDSLNSAQLLLTLTDGSQKIVTLSGFGIPRAPLSLATQDATVDTLGASTIIPITLNGLHKPENITLIVHYDTVLNYNGSFSGAGAKLDIPNEQWNGRSKLSIPNAIPNTIQGYAHFDVFKDSVPSQHVRFDSITVLSAASICQYLTDVSATSTITPLSGCGVLSISRFLHHNIFPELKIIPNPANGDASLSSSLDLGEVHLTVYDMLGSERGNQIITLTKNSPSKISLPPVNGVYTLRVKSATESYDLRVIVSR
jgi:photosystem II stability/assembly factor-like uncharacterized protein